MGRLKSAVLVGFSLCFLTSSLSAAIPASERAALIALYNSTGGGSWSHNAGWKTPSLDADGFAMPGTEGSWYGVTLSSDNANLQKLDLGNNGLIGTIPPELGNLTSLQELNLGWNNFPGSIPTELGHLTNLKILNLIDSHLTGVIPGELGNLTNLETLYLDRNRLSGSIPAALGNLHNLRTLELNENQLPGLSPRNLAIWPVCEA
jgi:Leucine-rich repeat (LRR) protein